MIAEKRTSIEVLIPAYNAAETIRGTLRSVMHQSFPLDKITVVDDGSTDDTRKIVAEFPRIGLIQNDKNIDSCANWNRCVEISSSQFICILHADDLLAPEWHQRCMNALAMSGFSEDCFLHVGAVCFFHNGGLRELFSFGRDVTRYRPGEFLRVLWRSCNYGIPCSGCVVYPSAMLERFGPFPSQDYPSMADVPYHWKLLCRAPMVYDPKILVFVRHGWANQVSPARRAEHAEGAVRAFVDVLPELSGVLDRDVKQLMADYLFPYWVIGMKSHLLRERMDISTNVYDKARSALAAAGPNAVLRNAIRQAAERSKRRIALWSRRKSLLNTIANLETQSIE